MKVSVTSRLYIGFLAAFIISAIVGGVSYWTFKRQTEEAQWVKHTYEVINKVQEIQTICIDMETGRRGYRSTGEKRFLEPYNVGLRRIQPTLNSLKELVKDNAKETTRVNELIRRVDKVIEYWRERGEILNSGLSTDSLMKVTEQEKILVDAVREVIHDIEDSENRLLIEREEATKDAVSFASWTSLIGSIVVQLIIIILIYFIISEFNNRRKAELALKDNLDELEKLNKESSDKNWMLTGLSNVNASLQGINDVSALTQLVITSLVKYLNLPAGAIYIYDDEHDRLELKGSIALPDNAYKTYKLHEGIVGDAATGKDVRVVSKVPSGYWHIQSGSGKARPGQIACVPLWYNQELKGVIELATFGEFDALQVSLLRTLMSSVAVAINAADARERIIRLLDQVQQQKEDLQQQEEELRQTNEELTQQAEILQASEEELKVQEEELRQINAELEEKNEAVEIARQSLAAKALELEITGKYKSEFLANMSHELRTPLNSVLILAKLLADNKQHNLTSKQVEYASVIHKSGNDLLNLINDILDLSKIEAGKIDLNFEQVDVKGIANDIRLLFSVLAEERSVRFDINVDKFFPQTIQTDKLRLEQIIKNLLSNAFKFTSKGGNVTLSFDVMTPPAALRNEDIRNAEKVIAVAVKDTGIGIPRDKQQMIFEAFQQADGSTSRRYGGTGLGLSISKELIKKLGGEIRLESEEGQGSTFTIYLPVDGMQSVERTPVQQEEPVVIEGIVPQTKIADDRVSIAGNDKVMLIIEDDEHFARILQDYARERQYKTIVALQGDEGLYYARLYLPSAIILDMQLPVLSGGQVLKALKAEEKLKNIPVHIISAYDEAMQAAPGAIAYLKKPVEKHDLENVFSLIGTYTMSGVKRMLVLSGDYLKNNSLTSFIDKRHFDVECDYAATEREAKELLKTNKYDCVIADIGKNLEKGIKEVQQLKPLLEENKIPVIIYMDKDISAADELKLKKISNIVIRDSVQSKDRLMDELELFLYRVQEVENADIPRRQPIITDDKILNGKKVLLVDDDVRNVFALNTLLEEQNMNVITAENGKEALDQLSHNADLDIILMDVMMPEMDGYEAIRRIRADQRFAKLPIIALTAKAMVGDREKSIEAGASDYITKPVDNSRLLSLMRVWLA